MADPNLDRQRLRWPQYAACAWALVFAAPHTWWALGSPMGFPGGFPSYRIGMSGWRYAFDVVVILLSILGAVVALSLSRPRDSKTQRLFRFLAWAACIILAARGVAGLIADGLGDLIWSPMFVVGGVLFGIAAWVTRARVVASAA